VRDVGRAEDEDDDCECHDQCGDGQGLGDERVEEHEDGAEREGGVDDSVGVVSPGDPPDAQEGGDRHSDGEGGGDVAELGAVGDDVDLDLDARE